MQSVLVQRQIDINKSFVYSIYLALTGIIASFAFLEMRMCSSAQMDTMITLRWMPGACHES